MPFAKRVDHTDPDFLGALADEIAALVNVRGRAGVLIRLHALGDFFSTDYVAFWQTQLRLWSNLALYGYSAHNPLSPIGLALIGLNSEFPESCMIRFSNAGMLSMSTVSIGAPESCPPNAFICPEQTARTRCCATCGACWGTARNVAFLEH